MYISSKLKELKIEIPQLSIPGGNYKSIIVRSNHFSVAIQMPKFGSEDRFQGLIGNEVLVEDAYYASQLCGVNSLLHIENSIDFKDLVGITHIDYYYNVSKSTDLIPHIANGASDLFVNVLGTKGEHTRAIFGVSHLPKNFCIGISVSGIIEKNK
jgi:hypothetical protein